MPDTWMIVWLFWLGLFLVFELMAVILRKRTLSQQTWGWFSLAERKRYWQARRAIFAIFWILLGIHFYFQAPALYTVILPGIPFAAVIMLSSFVWKDATTGVEKEQSSMKSLLSKLWSGLKGVGKWTLSRGPLWSSLLVGASVVVPGAAPVLKALAAVLAGASGGTVDQQAVESFGAVVSGVLLTLGAVRKFWKIAKPMLAPPAGK